MITGRKSGQNLQQKRDNLGDDLLARIFHRQLLFLPARFGGALLFRPQRLQQLLKNSGPFSDHNCWGIYWVKNICDQHFKDTMVKTRFDWGNTLAKAQKTSCQRNCLITPCCDQTISICRQTVKTFANLSAVAKLWPKLTQLGQSCKVQKPHQLT